MMWELSEEITFFLKYFASQEVEVEPARDGSITAVALYDYQAMAEDEISFDPNDIITNIEMVSEI